MLRGHKDTVKSSQFCANASKILTASYDKSILLWDVATGASVKRFEKHSAFVSQAKASADGARSGDNSPLSLFTI